MEDKVINTPNGYVATIKTSLTFGQLEDIQAVMTDNIQLNPETGKPQSVDFKLIRESNKKALEFLLVGITKGDVAFIGTIRDLPAKDGKMIMDEINTITNEASRELKKGI